MAATFTIQDITNPDLSYEERARLRKERREKKHGGSIDLKVRSSSPSRPFRTHSPTVEPSLAPTLGFPSEFAYIASLSPSSSPSPSRRQHLTSPDGPSPPRGQHLTSPDGSRIRTVSEPVDMKELSTYGNENKGESNGKSDDEDFGFPQHVPIAFPYDSRTPRLTRGALNRSNVIYRKDLDDFNKEDITVVMSPRDTTLERHHEKSNQQHQVVKDRKISEDNSGKKKGMVIVPSVSQTSISIDHVDIAADVPEETRNEETKNEGAGKQRKLSKTFSFLSKKEKGEKKKSPAKEKKKISSAEKKLSSSGLSGISMPNLHSPSSEEPLSPEGQGPKMNIFRRKHNKKSNVQRTSWTFQQSIPDTSLQPAMSLQNIAESPTGLPTYDMVASNRTSSMEHIPNFSSDDLNVPITVFGSRDHDDEDDEDNELPFYNKAMYDPNGAMRDRSPSPLSIGSISIDIPDLPDSSKPVTPQPTLNDITSKFVKKVETPSDKRNDASATAEKKNSMSTEPQGKEDIPKSTRKETPKSTSEDTPMNTRKDTPQSTSEDTPMNTRKDTPQSTSEDTPKSTRKDTPQSISEDTPKSTRKGTPQSAGEDTPKTTMKKNTSAGNVAETTSAENSEDQKNFKRNLGSRKPLRKQSLSGKDSPNLKKRYSSLRATEESPTERPTSVSPSVLSDSPRTTPTNSQKSNTNSPTGRRVSNKGKTSAHTQTNSARTPTNSPKATRRFTPSPTKTARRSPSNSPLSSPVATRKAKSITKSPLSTPTASRKLKKSSLTNLSLKDSPKAARKNQQESKNKSKASESSKPLDSPITRKRRLGITSITSPLSEEKNLNTVQPQTETATKSKIVPKRSAPEPPTRKSGSEMDLNVSDIVKSPASPAGDKIKPKVSTPVDKCKSVPSATKDEKTTKEMYVYQSRYKKKSSAAQSPPPAAAKESLTYKYTTGSLGKKTSLPTITTSTKERSSGRGKQSPVVPESQKKTSVPSAKKPSVEGGLKPPLPNKATTRQIKSETNLLSSIRKQQKLSLVETGTPKQTSTVVKSNSEDNEEPTTLDILKPLDSILSFSTDKLSKSPSFPPLESMLARPFSPTSPQLSEEEGDISLTPEVPLDREDKLQFIYRSTLLRKTNCDDNIPMIRSFSNKSIGPESTRASFSRTSSPRKSLSGSPSRQSKKVSTSSPFRRGSLAVPTRKGSTTSLSRRPSSGDPREKSSTLGRPRSASQINIYQSLRRSSKPSLAPPSALTRQSLRSKKTSADSVNSKKPPSGLQNSKRSHPQFTTKATNDSTDGTIVSTTTESSSIQKSTSTTTISYSKPKKIIAKAHSSAECEIKNSSNIRKSLKISKSVDSQKPHLAKSNSACLKPPSGSTLGRSLKQKTSVESPFQNARASVRMSRRSSAGTVKKVSQSNSPLHTSNKTSPIHRTLTRSLKREDTADTVEAFEYVSSIADKTKLSSVADHKRQVRPRTKHRPSPGHLQMLSQRKDVSSELETAKPDPDENSGVDPNAYSTYMGKKKLDKTALAGLAAKLDFSTVQLRKTGIVEQMMSDSNGGTNKHRVDDLQNSYGVQVTTHPLMLLMIKGRKNLQTRLVEPTAMSINSGDIFILVAEKDLFLWQGKEANVLEKARANDIVNRIYQKRELGCRASGYTHLDDEGVKKDLPKKYQVFWELLKGKPTMKKDINLVPSDEMYEKGVSCATKVYQFMMEGDIGKFVVIHEDTVQPLKIALLDTKKVLLFDFCSEVYVWMGKRCPQSYRKAAMIKARKLYDNGFIPPVFSNTASPKKIMPTTARQSGRFHSKMHQKHGTLSGSMRKKTLDRKPSKGSLHDRPSWSLFSRVNEGSESILFREKFVDWPEPGRIIKMRGHESSGEVIKPPPMPELQPADVHQMLKPRSNFEGMRLEGENIHRGHGNYKVSRSTFACNRVRSQKIEKYLVKDSDNVLLPERSHGIFYSGEGYVFRWSYVITVVRELEGLTPGAGMFAMDRKYQKELQNKKKKQGDENAPTKTKEIKEDDSSDEDVDDSDDESKRVLESGGRDRVAYFFWQGEHASINEKGAAAVITVEMDKERAPQIRVTQGKEHPAFLQMFRGTMIIVHGKSEKNSIDLCPRGYRIYAVQGNAKKEACLVEINVKNHPLFYYTRSRGCYVIQHKASSTIYTWIGSKATETLKGVAALASRNLKRRLDSFKVVKVLEGAEPKELCNLMGSRTLYHSLLNVQKPLEYTPRLFHLSSSTGWFVATEELHISMPDSTEVPDPFPFLQENIYNATQPGLFLLDADTEIYLWMGWWPVQKNKLLQEKNAFSGLAQSRWAKDKKLALETAMMYAEGCKRTPIPKVYVVNAGTEHTEFINLFPIWNEWEDVQEIVGSTAPSRTLAEKELAKYNKTNYTLKELLKRPEEVDASKLETYLSDEEFEQIFKMPRDQFSKMLLWKQVDLKKKVGLF